jgi:hypothetical protein
MIDESVDYEGNDFYICLCLVKEGDRFVFYGDKEGDGLGTDGSYASCVVDLNMSEWLKIIKKAVCYMNEEEIGELKEYIGLLSRAEKSDA